MFFRETLSVRMAGRGFEMITARVAETVRKSGIASGLCNVFLTHTSASVLISENADPAVRRDLERFMARVAPESSTDYEHDTEGLDDMPAHIRSILAGVTLSIPVERGRLLLGTWQGIYVWEHRASAQTRDVVVTIVGE